MALRTKETKRLLTVHRGTEEETEHATHLVVEFPGRIFTLLDPLLIGISHIIEVVGVGLAHCQTIGPRTELHVETIGDGFVRIMTAAPVGDDHTIILPVTLQDLVKHDVIVAVVLVLIEIIGTHDTPCASLRDSRLEGGQVDLVQGTVRDNDVHLMTILLIVVQGIVLHTGGHTLRLEPLDIRHHHP